MIQMKTTSYIYRLMLEYYADAVYNMHKTCTYLHGVNKGLLLRSVTACHMCAIASEMIIRGEY